MKLLHIDALLLAVATAIAISATIRVRAVLSVPRIDSISAVPPSTGGRSGKPIVAVPTSRVADDSADYSAFVVDNDLFRLANAPSAVRYSAASDGVSPQQPTVVKPQLSVKAIVGGPPWQAMLDGIPNSGQVIVRGGQVIGGLTVRSVARDTVVVQGMDTTWKLTLYGSHP